MIALFIWFILLALRSFFCDYLSKDEFHCDSIIKRIFPGLLLFWGILHLFKIVDANDYYFLSNSFQNIGLSKQIDQGLLFIPFLIIFSQILKGFGKKGAFLLTVATMTAVASYNINIIFSILIICDFFLIERGNKTLRVLRRESAILLLVIFPFISGGREIFSEIFFLLLIIASILDIFSIGQDKKNDNKVQFYNMLLILPLRLTILMYFVTNGLVSSYMDFAKIIIVFSIIITFFYAVSTRFDLRSLLMLAQTLLLSCALSTLGPIYMELYFLIALLVTFGTEVEIQEKKIKWGFMGPLLIILLSLFDGKPRLIKMFLTLFNGDDYSKIIGISLILFFTILSFQWGQSLKKIKGLGVRKGEQFYIFVLIGSIIFNAKYNTAEYVGPADWTNKIIVSFYFIIILLSSYAINIPIINFKKPSKLFFMRPPQLNGERMGRLPFKIADNVLMFSLNGLWSLISFIQGIIVNFFLILVDAYEYKNIKKYQHFAMLLLIIFLFLWMKIFANNQ